MRKDEDLEEIKKGNGLNNAKITENASDKNLKTIVVKKIPFNKLRRVTWQKSKRSTNRNGRGTTTVVHLSPELNVDGVGTIKVIRKHPRVGNGVTMQTRLYRSKGGTTTTIRKNNKKG